MSEYWLISAPGEKTCQQTFDTMNNLTSRQNNLCINHKFHIPDLKVGTLDQLVGLSDDLGKLDVFVEQITRKVAAYLGEVLEDQRDKLHENLLANNSPGPGPGPPDDHANNHSDLIGKSSNFLNNRDSSTTKTATIVTTNVNCSACQIGSLNNISLTEETKHEFDLLSSSLCTCDACNIATATSAAVVVSTEADPFQMPINAADNYNSFAPSHIHKSTISNVNSPTADIANVVDTTPPSHACCSSSALFQETAVYKASTTDQFHCSNNNNNNNNCNFTNIRKLCMKSTNISKLSDAATTLFVSDEFHTKSNSSTSSDVSDPFDWWGHRQRRSSKRSRSYPMSSCCGNSSQGRSSPEPDLDEAPTLLLSPVELAVYITRFQWDMAKYPIKQSLRNIADIISKQIGQIDADLKTKSTAYNNLKGSLQNLEKKQTGSLLTRNLSDLVKKEHFILDSEYLTTLLVIVPKVMAQEWTSSYEKITDMIVPRSSTLITQDNDYCLFNVTLFKKVVEEFKLHARERKFIVRDFVYNEEEMAAGKNEITKLITDKKKQFGPLVRWLKVNFSEAFCALVHVKALRVFVESVLRYGLPVNFQAILIEPNKKSMKRLRECLNQLYGHLDGGSGSGQVSSVDNVDIPGLGFGQSEYYPYVFYKINIDMVETVKV